MLLQKLYKTLNLRGINVWLEPTTQATVLKLLNKINPSKSTVVNNLEGKFLKEGAPVLVSPVTDLFNFSVELLSLSKNCKIAKLKPLYEKESKSKPKHYRPVSPLLLISKVVEKLIPNQTQEFWDTNEILYTHQSGFCKNCSTDTCLFYLTDKA